MLPAPFAIFILLRRSHASLHSAIQNHRSAYTRQEITTNVFYSPTQTFTTPAFMSLLFSRSPFSTSGKNAVPKTLIATDLFCWKIWHAVYSGISLNSAIHVTKRHAVGRVWRGALPSANDVCLSTRGVCTWREMGDTVFTSKDRRRQPTRNHRRIRIRTSYQTTRKPNLQITQLLSFTSCIFSASTSHIVY